MTKEVTIFVRLLDEGTEVKRPAEALELGDGTFRILGAANYDPTDEVWEFPPGSLVRAKEQIGAEGAYLLAIQL